MNLRLCFTLAALLLAVTRASSASLLRENVNAFNFWPPDPSYARLTPVSVAGPHFSSALLAQILKRPTNPWDLQLNSPTLATVNKDDVIAGELWLRRVAPASGEAIAEIVFEHAGEPYIQSLVRSVREGRGEWTRFRFAFQSKDTYAPGKAQANLRLGAQVQSVEIGPFVMTNYARTRPLAGFTNDAMTLTEIGGSSNPDPVRLLPGLDTFTLLRPDDSFAVSSLVPVTGQTFTQARRVRTLKVPTAPWSIQLNGLTSRAIAKGDVIAGEVWIRRAATPPADAITELVFERAGDPYTQSILRVLTEGSGQWQQFRFAFESAETYAAGQAQVNLRLGYRIQSIEIAALTLTNHARSRPLSDFPNDVTYPERAADAAWRAEADQRIDQFRKANLTVEVRDASGKPVPGAAVTVRQIRHAFPFGSAVASDLLLQNSADGDRYRRVITNWFTRCVLENDLKWPQWEADRATAQSGVRWLRQHRIDVRGHNLIWPSRRNMPANTAPLFTQPEALRQRIRDHFADVLGPLAGQCVDWDVINEPYTEHEVMDLLGAGEMKSWLQLARALDPTARLYINDYNNIDAVPGGNQAEGFFALAKSLVAQEAPLDGLGFQSHIAGYLAPPSQVYQAIDRFAALVPEVSVTELDVNCSDPAAQADYLRDFTTIAFSHPKTRAILLWGFWEGRMWIPNAGLFRPDWSLKPSGVAWSNLVLRAWWTHTNATTDASGHATIRGFKGDYEVEITTPGSTQSYTTPLLIDTTLLAGPEVDPTPPRVTWTRSAAQAFLNWPAEHTGFHVEYTPLLPTATWQPVQQQAALTDGVWTLAVPPTPGFFRLAR